MKKSFESTDDDLGKSRLNALYNNYFYKSNKNTKFQKLEVPFLKGIVQFTIFYKNFNP